MDKYILNPKILDPNEFEKCSLYRIGNWMQGLTKSSLCLYTKVAEVHMQIYFLTWRTFKDIGRNHIWAWKTTHAFLLKVVQKSSWPPLKLVL